jgi:glutamate dehydrogenase (NADP+)
MLAIHASCEYGKDASGYVDYVKGANIAGFVKVADAMLGKEWFNTFYTRKSLLPF